MTYLEQIIQIHKQDPELSSDQIARMVGCDKRNVHEAAFKDGLDIPTVAKITLPTVSFLERDDSDVE